MPADDRHTPGERRDAATQPDRLGLLWRWVALDMQVGELSHRERQAFGDVMRRGVAHRARLTWAAGVGATFGAAIGAPVLDHIGHGLGWW